MKNSLLQKIRVVLFASPLLLLQANCKENSASSTDESGVFANVETNKPNTDYAPAFQGQTRANGTLPSKFDFEVVSSSLSLPWGITNLPAGRLLITEKAGTMRIVSLDGTLSSPITGLPDVNDEGQGGLLGVCVDPAFNSNRIIYWVFSEAIVGGNVTAVAKGRLSDSETKVENISIIYRANPANNSALHYGGRILFDKTGHLLVSTGERSVLETRPLSQSVTSALGKIVRITKNGKPAPGNPTFDQSDAFPELYSFGHRNPQGIALHPVTNELWSSEFGPQGGDEINKVKAGLNYGWPTISYGLEYGGDPIGNGITKKEGLEQPVYYWDPVISPSGITFYSGNKIPEWENNLFVAALSGQHIARLVIEDDKVIAEERLLSDQNQRFRDITQGNDGALYAITDQGRLYKIYRK